MIDSRKVLARSVIVALASALLGAAPSPSPSPSAALSPLPSPAASGTSNVNPTACSASALSLRADFGGGEFTGMSHAGERAIVTNTSQQSCTVPRRATFAMLDAKGTPLPIAGKFPPTVGMHPGPVLVPIVLAPGASASTTLRWVASNVFENGTCVTVSELSMKTAAGDAVIAPSPANVCGPATGATFDVYMLTKGVQ